MENEIWLQITEFPDYEVSNKGRVRDLRRGGKILDHRIKDGSINVALRASKNFFRCRRLAKLVWSAFVDPKVPYGAQFEYKNGDKSDCSIENLIRKNHGRKTVYELPVGFMDQLKDLVRTIESQNFIIDVVTMLTLVSLHVDIHGEQYDRHPPLEQLMMMYADIKKYIKEFGE